MRRTKIVATLGPASSSPEIIRQLITTGMDVARLNFSHGTYVEHARNIGSIRAISEALDTPVTILQDLQGPKIRAPLQDFMKKLMLGLGDMKIRRSDSTL